MTPWMEGLFFLRGDVHPTSLLDHDIPQARAGSERAHGKRTVRCMGRPFVIWSITRWATLLGIRGGGGKEAEHGEAPDWPVSWKARVCAILLKNSSGRSTYIRVQQILFLGHVLAGKNEKNVHPYLWQTSPTTGLTQPSPEITSRLE